MIRTQTMNQQPSLPVQRDVVNVSHNLLYIYDLNQRQKRGDPGFSLMSYCNYKSMDGFIQVVDQWLIVTGVHIFKVYS